MPRKYDQDNQDNEGRSERAKRRSASNGSYAEASHAKGCVGKRSRIIIFDSEEAMDVETSCEARPDAATTGQPTGAERRRYERLPLTLHGRYMLPDGSEFPCQTQDVSAIGIGIRGAPAGAIGERIVAYFEELGRVEGRIVRRAQTWFAVDITATPRKLEILAKTIRSLAARQAGEAGTVGE
jgi:hypothetical protein